MKYIKNLTCKRRILFSFLFIALFQLLTIGQGFAEERCDAGSKCFFREGQKAECTSGASCFGINATLDCNSGAHCFGINSTLSCGSGAQCTNYGTPEPSCTNGYCYSKPLPGVDCTWKEGSEVPACKGPLGSIQTLDNGYQCPVNSIACWNVCCKPGQVCHESTRQCIDFNTPS